MYFFNVLLDCLRHSDVLECRHDLSRLCEACATIASLWRE